MRMMEFATNEKERWKYYLWELKKGKDFMMDHDEEEYLLKDLGWTKVEVEKEKEIRLITNRIWVDFISGELNWKDLIARLAYIALQEKKEGKQYRNSDEFYDDWIYRLYWSTKQKSKIVELLWAIWNKYNFDDLFGEEDAA